VTGPDGSREPLVSTRIHGHCRGVAQPAIDPGRARVRIPGPEDPPTCFINGASRLRVGALKNIVT
jgi:hypothetical protein